MIPLFFPHILFQEPVQDLIPGQSAVADPGKAVLLIVFRQIHKNLRWSLESFLQQLHRRRELAAVIVDLDHVLHAFQTDHIAVRKPLCGKHFIWRDSPVFQIICRNLLLHVGSF